MKITIIGCGNMGKAFAKRLSQTNQLFLYDHKIINAESLANQGYGIACNDVRAAIKATDMIILAVKPQSLDDVATTIAGCIQENQIIISMLAGTPIKALEQYFQNANVVRMMPNLPLIYGKGVIGLSANEKLQKEVKENLTKTFEVLGEIFWIQEEKMNGLTALTGSGPAFFFTILEAMVDAGIAIGFNAKEAQELIYQMIQGSLVLLKNSGKHPGELRWEISSPQGTTITGLRQLEQTALRGGIINAFFAAYEHGRDLSSQN
ncbi:MAG: pyrroline-5-carboxylate reductase [Simkaniaceae bacterium]|nr:pyrroline-5-carboxylate reductase [Simkaniaceae bacterium]